MKNAFNRQRQVGSIQGRLELAESTVITYKSVMIQVSSIARNVKSLCLRLDRYEGLGEAQRPRGMSQGCFSEIKQSSQV